MPVFPGHRRIIATFHQHYLVSYQDQQDGDAIRSQDRMRQAQLALLDINRMTGAWLAPFAGAGHGADAHRQALRRAQNWIPVLLPPPRWSRRVPCAAVHRFETSPPPSTSFRCSSLDRAVLCCPRRLLAWHSCHSPAAYSSPSSPNPHNHCGPILAQYTPTSSLSSLDCFSSPSPAHVMNSRIGQRLTSTYRQSESFLDSPQPTLSVLQCSFPIGVPIPSTA